MQPVLVLLPAGTSDVPAPLPAAEVHRYSSPLDIPGILASLPLPAVLVRDAVSEAFAERVAEAISEHPHPVIVVASAPWDGERPDPLAAAAMGVVAGFGLRPIPYLVELLGA